MLQVVRREGIALWHELLPSIVSLSNKGPTEVYCLFRQLFLLILTMKYVLTNLLLFACW